MRNLLKSVRYHYIWGRAGGYPAAERVSIGYAPGDRSQDANSLQVRRR